MNLKVTFSESEQTFDANMGEVFPVGTGGEVDPAEVERIVEEYLEENPPAPGADGKDGTDGKDGVSPSVSVSDITGGHRITITDANGTKTVDVMDGVDGNDGKPGADGSPGKDGKNGADGYSPMRGVDYWTEGDIAEIKGYVYEAILGGAW